MDTNRAAELLDAERRRVEALLEETRDGAASDASQAREAGDYADPAQPLTDEGLQLALAEELEARLDAIARAEARLRDGTYGRSVRSGATIPDERLEADPTAELTVEEARGG